MLQSVGSQGVGHDCATKQQREQHQGLGREGLVKRAVKVTHPRGGLNSAPTEPVF